MFCLHPVLLALVVYFTQGAWEGFLFWWISLKFNSFGFFRNIVYINVFLLI